MVGNSSISSAFQQQFNGVDFNSIIKNILFFGYYINDLLVRLFTAILEGIGTPFTNYHSTIILMIIYMVGIYLAITLMQTVKPIIKWVIVGLIIWMVIGFFRI